MCHHIVNRATFSTVYDTMSLIVPFKAVRAQLTPLCLSFSMLTAEDHNHLGRINGLSTVITTEWVKINSVFRMLQCDLVSECLRFIVTTSGRERTSAVEGRSSKLYRSTQGSSQ